MEDFFEEYGFSAVEIIQGIFIVAILFAVLTGSVLTNSATFKSIDQTTTGAQVEYIIPTVEEGDFIVENAILDLNSVFDWRDYVTVSASNSIDLKDYISVIGEVDTSVTGEYTLKFSLHFNGKTIEKEATYYVREV